jgi:hypothetical protein
MFDAGMCSATRSREEVLEAADVSWGLKSSGAKIN